MPIGIAAYKVSDNYFIQSKSDFGPLHLSRTMSTSLNSNI